MTAIDTHMLAETPISATPIIERAIEFARQKCEPYLFNHVMRSWLFAVRIGQLKRIEHDPEVVALATLLHDVTLNENFDGPRRFEVEGADLARNFAREMGLDERRTQLIWDSVALNSTPSIGLYKEPEVALCTAGICLDVIGLQYNVISSDAMMKIVDEFPRLEMKTRMTQCFCHIAKVKPETTYDNFIRDFGERFVTGCRTPSVVDLVMNAPFKE
jgi:HD domain-containing protein